MRLAGDLLCRVCLFLVGQEALREKEAQVTKLLKERELERAEVTRAASQADHAEQLLASLSKDYEQFRKECELRLKEKDGNICKIQSERDSLISQLDEEKRRGEDLQFKFEEAAINKVDVEKLNAEQNDVNDTHVARIKELENLLNEERKKVEAHENESNRLFEAEEAYTRTKEELEILQQKIKSMHSSDEMVSSLQKQLDEYKNQLQESEKKQKELEHVYETDMLKLKSKSDEKYQSKSTEFNTIVEQYKKEIDLVKQQLSETQEEKKKMDAIVQKQMNEMSKLRIYSEEQSHKLEQKTKDVCDNAMKTEEKLQKEIEKLKMELSGKAFDIEASIEKVKNKDMLINELQVKLDAAVRELKTKDEDIEKHVRRKREAEEEHQKHIEEMKSALQATTDSFENHKISTAQELMSRQQEIADAQQRLVDGKSYISKLEYELNETKEVATKSANSLIEYEQQLKYLKEKDEKILELNSMYESSCHRLAECNDLNVKQELDIHQKDAQIETYKKDFQVLYVKLKKAEDDNCNLTAKINELELEVGDLTRKVASMQELSIVVTQQKQKLEIEIQSLLSSSYDSNDKITKLNEDLRGKERELEQFREEMNTKQLGCERETQELQQTITNLNTQLDLEKTENVKQITELTDAKAELENQLRDANDNLRKVEDKLKSEIKALSAICDTRRAELEIKIETHEQTEVNLNLKINELLAEKENNIKTFNEKIQQLEEGKDQLQKSLKEKTDLFIEIQAKCERIQSDAKANEAEMKNHFTNEIKRLQEDIEDFEKKIVEKDSLISELNLKMNVCKQDNSAVNESIQQQVKLLEVLKLELLKAQNDYKHLQEEHGNKVQVIVTLEQQIDELTKVKKECEDKNADLDKRLKDANQELDNIKQEYLSAQNVTAEKDTEIMALKNQFEQTVDNRCMALETEIANLTSLYQEAQIELDTWKKNFSEKEISEKNLRDELEKVKQEGCTKYEDSLVQLFNLQQKCEELKKQEEDSNLVRDREIKNLRRQLDEKTRDKKEVDDDKYIYLQKQYEDALKEKDEIYKKCVSAENQVTNLNKNLDDAKNTNRAELEAKANIEGQCENYKKQIDDLRIEMMNKDAIIEGLRADINVCIQEHNVNLETLKMEIGLKNEALSLCQLKQSNECSEYAAQLQQKENELIILREANDKCKGLTLEINRQANELINKNNQIDELNKKIKALIPNDNPVYCDNNAVPIAEVSQPDCNNLKDQILKLKPYVESTNKLTAELHREKLYIIELENKLQKLMNENKDLMTKMQSFVTRLFNSTGKKGDLKQCAKDKDVLVSKIKGLQVEMQTLVDEINLCQSQKSPASNDWTLDTNSRMDSQLNLNDKYQPVGESLNKVVVSDISVMNGNVNIQMEKLQEAQGQIEFLNSIIADMQVKNEELRNKVQELEATSGGSDAYEISIHGVIQPRSVAPRMFCDICDSFDLHETEDCPHQSNDSPPPLHDIRHHMPKELSDRPYCEICEVFGHSTENCDDTETY